MTLARPTGHRRRRRTTRHALQVASVICVAAVFIPVSAAFTSSGTLRPAGEGSSQTSGYAVSSVHFGLDPTNPADLASVSFTIAPSNATTVRVQLQPNGEWYTCAVGGGTATCPTGSSRLPVAAAVALDVVASA